MKVRMYKVVVAALLLVVGLALTFVGDIWTIPAQNEVAMSQLNGNGTDMVVMHTTNSALRVVRCGIMPLMLLIVLAMGIVEGKRIMKEMEKKGNS